MNELNQKAIDDRGLRRKHVAVPDSRLQNAQAYMSKEELQDSRARMRNALQFDPAAACDNVPTPAASYMDTLAQVNTELERLREAHDLLRTSLSPFLQVPIPTPMRDEPMSPETRESDASLVIFGIIRQVRAATEDILNVIDRFRP